MEASLHAGFQLSACHQAVQMQQGSYWVELTALRICRRLPLPASSRSFPWKMLAAKVVVRLQPSGAHFEVVKLLLALARRRGGLPAEVALLRLAYNTVGFGVAAYFQLQGKVSGWRMPEAVWMLHVLLVPAMTMTANDGLGWYTHYKYMGNVGRLKSEQPTKRHRIR